MRTRAKEKRKKKKEKRKKRSKRKLKGTRTRARYTPLASFVWFHDVTGRKQREEDTHTTEKQRD